MFHQNSAGSICQSRFGIHTNVKMLAVLFSSGFSALNISDRGAFVYGNKVQLSLHKKYLSVINPDKHKEKVIAEK